MLQLKQHQQASLKQQLTSDGFARIDNILADSDAEQLHQCLLGLDYNTALFHQNTVKTVSDQQLAALTPQERQVLFEDIYSDAARGLGFMYCRHSVGAHSPRALNQLYQSLNNPALQQLISEISGEQIIHTSAQATRYISGQYLTRHTDVVESEGRVYAYVLGVSKNWHPDWGGLLQLFERDGTPTTSYAPRFNSLVVFDVKKVHSVTYVAPYAKGPRLSVTGWFRTKA